jgi:hypothetical protein
MLSIKGILVLQGLVQDHVAANSTTDAFLECGVHMFRFLIAEAAFRLQFFRIAKHFFQVVLCSFKSLSSSTTTLPFFPASLHWHLQDLCRLLGFGSLDDLQCIVLGRLQSVDDAMQSQHQVQTTFLAQV